MPLLSLLVWTPILGGVLVLWAGDQRREQARWIALLVSLAALGLCVPLYTGFDASSAAMQFEENRTWISALQVRYHLGVDGFSVPLILLTAFFGPLVVVAAWESVQDKVHQYLAAFLIMQGLMIGVFAALDGLLFYVFFEAMLIPMFLVIGMWGGPRRVYATIKFFLYTFAGSVFLLVAVVYLYNQADSWSILAWHDLPLSMREQTWLFLGLLAAFAVKIPMWPVHTWLPDAHVEAPTGGSVVLAAIMLKIGGYGFIRLSLPITPDASANLDWLLITLSLVAIVYISFVALVQQDMKKLIAYSSVSHMGFATLGLFVAFGIFRQQGGAVSEGFSGAALGVQGSMVQMVSHGFVSGALFLCVGVLYDRVHSREITAYGGVANTMPWFAFFAVLFLMANAGLPGTSGFVGEFMVILSSFRANFWFAFLAGTTLVLGAAYSLWLVKRVIFGAVANANVATLNDLNGREALLLGLLAVVVLGIGVWPQPLVELMGASVDQLLVHIAQSKLT